MIDPSAHPTDGAPSDDPTVGHSSEPAGHARFSNLLRAGVIVAVGMALQRALFLIVFFVGILAMNGREGALPFPFNVLWFLVPLLSAAAAYVAVTAIWHLLPNGFTGGRRGIAAGTRLAIVASLLPTIAGLVERAFHVVTR